MRETLRVLIFFSKVSMLVSTSLSRRSSERPWLWLLGECLYKWTHTVTRVLLVLLSYLTNSECFPLYFSHRTALFSAQRWKLKRASEHCFVSFQTVVKRACEKRKWKNIDVISYIKREKKLDLRAGILKKIRIHKYIFSNRMFI